MTTVVLPKSEWETLKREVDSLTGHPPSRDTSGIESVVVHAPLNINGRMLAKATYVGPDNPLEVNTNPFSEAKE